MCTSLGSHWRIGAERDMLRAAGLRDHHSNHILSSTPVFFRGFSWINTSQGVQRLPSLSTDEEIETQWDSVRLARPRPYNKKVAVDLANFLNTLRNTTNPSSCISSAPSLSPVLPREMKKLARDSWCLVQSPWNKWIISSDRELILLHYPAGHPGASRGMNFPGWLKLAWCPGSTMTMVMS